MVTTKLTDKQKLLMLAKQVNDARIKWRDSNISYTEFKNTVKKYHSFIDTMIKKYGKTETYSIWLSLPIKRGDWSNIEFPYNKFK